MRASSSWSGPHFHEYAPLDASSSSSSSSPSDLLPGQRENQQWLDRSLSDLGMQLEELERITMQVRADAREDFSDMEGVFEDLVKTLSHLRHWDQPPSVLGPDQENRLHALCARFRRWCRDTLLAVTPTQPLLHDALRWPLAAAQMIALLDEMQHMEYQLCSSVSCEAEEDFCPLGWHTEEGAKLEEEAGLCVLRGHGSKRDHWVVAATGYQESRLPQANLHASAPTVRLLHAYHLHAQWRQGRFASHHKVSVIGSPVGSDQKRYVRYQKLAHLLAAQGYTLGPPMLSLEMEGHGTERLHTCIMEGDLITHAADALYTLGTTLPRVSQKIHLLLSVAQLIERVLDNHLFILPTAEHIIAWARPDSPPRWGALPGIPIGRLDPSQQADKLAQVGKVLQSWSQRLLGPPENHIESTGQWAEWPDSARAHAIMHAAKKLIETPTLAQLRNYMHSLESTFGEPVREPSYHIPIDPERLRKKSADDTAALLAGSLELGLEGSHQRWQELHNLYTELLAEDPDSSMDSIALELSRRSHQRILALLGGCWIAESTLQKRDEDEVTLVRSLDFGWTARPFVLKIAHDWEQPFASRIGLGGALHGLAYEGNKAEPLPCLIGLAAHSSSEGSEPSSEAHEPPTTVYLLMSYEGRSLYSVKADGSSPQALVNIAHLSAQHLALLHRQRRVTHSDLSSGNLLHSGVLIDLDRCAGLHTPNWRCPIDPQEDHPYSSVLHPAFLVAHEEYASDRNAAGTPPFVSPERLRHGDQAQSPAGDVYAWGVLYAALLVDQDYQRVHALRDLYSDDHDTQPAAWTAYLRDLQTQHPDAWPSFVSSEVLQARAEEASPLIRALLELVGEALSPHPLRRPSAQNVADRLAKAIEENIPPRANH